MLAIDVQNLTKVYPVAVKQPGVVGTLRHFFRRQYRQVKAVNDVSFTIEPGEVVGFLGPNGAGKTTTLKMLTGLIYPSAGQVSVAGHTPFQRQRPFLEQITLVMGQKQQLIWDLPTLDSLRINGAIYELSNQELRHRIQELADMLDLTDKLTQPVRKLSLGERMKAEMLAALLHRPQVLFLDEPTLGLDVNAQMAVRQFLQDYNQRYQATIVLTSHYMADIKALCDRVLLIYQGQLIYDGALTSLVEQFAPYREVTAELAQDIPMETLGSYGEIQTMEGCKVVFLVRREDLTKTVSQVLAQLPVLDLTVTDPPIEDVIGRVFDAGIV
ncbi:ATP-binding cassette domain-containing protein [Leptolyngbya cf. ectocarpi LEGE 11479]|uniref:ATP-binding cassette domain-containing protein n=1 Tax=Leptolyngbya cf. ectocarpi LEGE 11479 TaxID=1828722 RepID=A0A928X0T1_LEPEC|nr:ATP-binding cassette domain-containing protein [Leptolyngbya ectocarpi]MBE9065434.1 ATP-binding cassette domain-containing protein [Leptolyngbya cf. ectocarpi LEGE 11479]